MATFIGGISSGPPTTSAPISAPLVAPGPIGSALTPQQVAAALGKTVKPPKGPPKVRGRGTKATNVYGVPQAPAVPTTQMPSQSQPPATPGASATTTSPPGLPTLDATAASNEATNIFDVGNKVQGLTDQTAAGFIAMQKALGDLAYQQPRDQLAQLQAANQRGALGSSVYAGQVGDLARDYGNRNAAAQGTFDALQTGNAAQITALNAGIPLYNQGQAADSAQRAIAAALANPATGQEPIPSTPQPSPPKGGGHYVNVDGKWVPIHAVGKNRWVPGLPPKKQ